MDEEDYIKEKINDLIENQDGDEDQYPEVPVDGMPEGVAKEIRKYKEMDEDERDEAVLLYHLLGGRGTPPYKMSKEESEYQEEPYGDQYCGNCSLAYYSNETGELICSNIRGKIDWDGWCKLWKEAEPDEVLQDHFGEVETGDSEE